MALELRKDFENKVTKYEVSDLIIKDPGIIQWIFEESLDRYQKDMYHYCVSLIKPTDNPGKVFEAIFDVSKFCKRHNIKSTGTYKRHFFDSIEKTIKESPRVWIHNKATGKGLGVTIFPSIRYDTKKGIAKIELNHHIHTYYIARKISIGSLRYTMDDLTALKTFNSTRLMDYILDNHAKNEVKDNGFSSVTIEIEKLFSILSYKTNGKTAVADFKRRIIGTIIRDLNANSSITLSDKSPIVIREGNKIVAFEFLYKFKRDKLPPVILENDEQLPFLQDLFKTTQEDDSVERMSNVNDNIDLSDRQIPSKEVMLQVFKSSFNILGKGWERLQKNDKTYLFKLYVFVRMRGSQEFVRGTFKLSNTVELSKYINWCTSHEQIVKIRDKNLHSMITEYHMNSQNGMGIPYPRSDFDNKYL